MLWLTRWSVFFPDAAAANEPPIVKQLLQQPEKLSLRFDLAYLPLGLHARLVQALFKPQQTIAIQETQAIWRQCFILKRLKLRLSCSTWYTVLV